MPLSFAGSRLTEMGRDRGEGLLALCRRPRTPVEDDPGDALGRQERDSVRLVHAADHGGDLAGDDRQALNLSGGAMRAPLERSLHEVGHALRVGAAQLELDVGQRA